MLALRSGLPEHAGELLEDLGYDRGDLIDQLKDEPLNLFRAICYDTHDGPTIGAEATARAAGGDWATLSEQDIDGPLGTTTTSSRFADFAANPNHAGARPRRRRVHPRTSAAARRAIAGRRGERLGHGHGDLARDGAEREQRRGRHPGGRHPSRSTPPYR